MFLVFEWYGDDDVVTGRRKTVCKEGEYVIYDNKSISCIVCPDCPAGMQLKFDCMLAIVYNTSIDLECEICPDGYYKVVHGHDACSKWTLLEEMY